MLFFIWIYLFQVEFNVAVVSTAHSSKSLTAKRACQKIYDNIFLEDCRKVVNLKFYYKYSACLYDYCNLDLLRKDITDPFAKNTHVIRPECTVSRTCVMCGVYYKYTMCATHCVV